ncbi:tyrosine-type recombinase/integrase [Microbacterium aquimaris]|uniref:Site-specific integrase n=1 Tax=Microbacterium aquimaris TaxID=459816 RepID=A0ABU5N844_9MICO|nr:site-specific integrase [Microbacterium aquimaris]MDZ8162162.1 site-specific integrase [Microbacterium aquimaris]
MDDAALSASSQPLMAATTRGPSIPIGTPYLLGTKFEYDIALNAFFYSASMLASRMTTRVGYARDLTAFLNFLTRNRGNRGWRDTTADDLKAYYAWRREDPLGPRVSASSWDRELAALNRFFSWQAREKTIPQNPIPQRQRRKYHARNSPRWGEDVTPAMLSHGGRRAKVEWLPSASYRVWRDIGVRGYGPDGRRDDAFRGRWASRNATFTDMLIRTGLRLTEQASLLTVELPAPSRTNGYHRFYLPRGIAKGGSERWIYVPSGVLHDLHEYVATDRAQIIERARKSGRYVPRHGALVVEPNARYATAYGTSQRVKLELLTPDERRQTLVEANGGFEPAALWLSESGDPMAVSSWKGIFLRASSRCVAQGVALSASAHLLRHSFAVITLEQLQRGHIDALRSLSLGQRTQYVRVFGEPMDWVRIRLGHRSVETTHIYLHALAELEMQTRMALIPDEWEDARDPHLVAKDSA